MRRVRNPYGSGSQELSSSIKSSQSQLSTNKIKRKIEIEKVSDDAIEDSYQDDEFEETYAS